MGLRKQVKKQEASDESVQALLFRIGMEEYALEIGSLVEVIRPFKITSLPRMPEFVEGVINLRGVIIPAVDMGRRFGLVGSGTAQRTARMVITKGAIAASPGRKGQGLLALVVDGVQDVIVIPKKQIEPAPEAARGRNADFIAGMGKVGERLVIFLDIDRILSTEERTALEEAGKEEPEQADR
ncbi:MAG: hypothetical protein A2X56_03410 [Nitrospirae bacterium GWC2_57_13]|jgi:purine-binding chemotaxis protein CheW|nr:MAG: hypothetical protein A2072_02160 [Nitrospirae bacterium GWC1_57_7]OGW28276.1 MAG: hypothetical protein A2X56_03410 [Nitrospirae bacterium GWC2_57_13]HAR44754.1 chemotaxis protein CheW [Nitrospiraceae bacterium]HAS53803.1 chemotaxis protein CheW [Nitrospiraceae bacterium]